MSRPTSDSTNPISGSAGDSDAAKSVDVVVPVYGNRATLSPLMQQIREAALPLARQCSVCFVDDCGRDGSLEVLRAIESEHPFVHVIEQPRNLGQHASIAHGLRASTAEIVIVMDADLQHPPKYIPEFVELIEQGFDIVIGRTTTKHAGRLRESLNHFWYGMLSLVGAPKESSALVCYSALSRSAVNAYLASHGCGKLYLGVLTRLGLPTAFCDIEIQPRPAGRSSYSWMKLIRLAGSVLRYRLSSKV